MMVERLFQALGLPHIGVQRTMIERIDPARDRLGVLVNQQFHPGIARGFFTQRIHVAELPRRIDVQQRKGRWRRVEGLTREMQHHRAVLADRIEHYRPVGFGHHFAHDVDAFGFEPVEMGKRRHGSRL